MTPSIYIQETARKSTSCKSSSIVEDDIEDAVRVTKANSTNSHKEKTIVCKQKCSRFESDYEVLEVNIYIFDNWKLKKIFYKRFGKIFFFLKKKIQTIPF